MRRTLRYYIPSMFHRRLLLLLVSAAMVALAAVGQAARLATGEAHQRYRLAAEEALTIPHLLPTVRGRILDRRGRVLAEDGLAYDVAVHYSVISGRWAYEQALAAARRRYREQWSELAPDEREALVLREKEPYDQQAEMLWRLLADLGRVDRAQIEQRKSQISQRINTVSSYLWVHWQQQRQAQLNEPVPLAEVAQPIGEQNQAHSILLDVDDQVQSVVRRLIADAQRNAQRPAQEREIGLLVWEKVELLRSRRRRYPFQTMTLMLDRSTLPSAIRSPEPQEITVTQVATHVLGRMRDVWEEDVTGPNGRPFNVNRDLGGYLPGDRVGSFGIEHAMESVLRGLRGRAILHRDTGQEDRIEPRPGRDVQLSIDIQLQARIQAILQPEWGLTTVQEWHGNPDVPLGTPLYGAAVVLDVDSGQVLAMVSTPTYPEEDQIDAAVRDINHPLINRPVAAVYAPGSTLKPIIYCLAARERAIEVGQIFTCNGAFDPRHPHQWRCWGYRPEQGLYHTHGSIGPAQAIATSCNIYFYNCGQRLGAQRLIRGLLDWGFGKPTGVELPEEISGLLPSLDGPNPPGYELTDSNAVNMGIGQGPIAVPPIQVAAAHAALARGGYWVSPTLLSSPMPTQSRHNLHLPPAAVEQALQGIYESANNPVYGTAHHLGGREPIMNAPGVVVRAKTGTAQAPVQFQDLNDNGRLDAEEPILRQGSHSWYVAHVAPTGHDRAQYIICVLVEYGGSGGRVSGPIANQIIHALKAEGYL